jgi:hypothetical protein
MAGDRLRENIQRLSDGLIQLVGGGEQICGRLLPPFELAEQNAPL